MSDKKKSDEQRVRDIVAVLVEHNPAMLDHWLALGEAIVGVAIPQLPKKSSTGR